MKKTHATSVVGVLLAGLLASACGLGTEIGNGVKSDDGGKKKKSDAAPASSKGSEPMDPAAETSNQAGDSSNTSGGANAPGTTPDTVDASSAMTSLPIDLLTTSCASPFSQDLASPISLVPEGAAAAAAPVLHASYDTVAKLWTVVTTSGTDRHVQKRSADDDTVIVTSPTNVAIADKYTCGPIQHSNDGVTSVRLTAKDGPVFDVEWTIESDSALSKLTRVLIQPEAPATAVVYVARDDAQP